MGVENKERAASVFFASFLVIGASLFGLAIVMAVEGRIAVGAVLALGGSAVVAAALIQRYGPQGRQHPSQIHRRWKSR